MNLGYRALFCGVESVQGLSVSEVQVLGQDLYLWNKAWDIGYLWA